MFDLTGRVAVITGAASGIGAETARVFARAGASVVLAAYDPDGHDIAGVVNDITADGGRAVALHADVRLTEDVDRLIATAVAEYGSLDIVVANAAIARKVPSEELDDATWNDLLDVDLTGVWRAFRAALPVMRSAGYGRLLATASTAGAMEAWAEHAHYSAAKAGILGIVRSLAAEVGPHGITVNAIAPGIIETPQTLDGTNSLGPDGVASTGRSQPVRRVGQPSDIAHAYLYLASEEASFVTGHTLVVDGGRMLVRG
ncbi:SDR family NAD(P)-dependent oxidoreductase [soil metagenome]